MLISKFPVVVYVRGLGWSLSYLSLCRLCFGEKAGKKIGKMEDQDIADNLFLFTCLNLFVIAVGGQLLINKHRHSCWVRGYLDKERKKNGVFNSLLKDLQMYDNVKLKNYLRMDMQTFEELLQLVSGSISTKNTKFR